MSRIMFAVTMLALIGLAVAVALTGGDPGSALAGGGLEWGGTGH